MTMMIVITQSANVKNSNVLAENKRTYFFGVKSFLSAKNHIIYKKGWQNYHVLGSSNKNQLSYSIEQEVIV